MKVNFPAKAQSPQRIKKLCGLCAFAGNILKPYRGEVD